MKENKLSNLDPGNTPFTVPLIGGDAAAIKRLANDESVENLGLQVQPDGKYASQLKERKETVEDWTGKAKTGRLVAGQISVTKLHTATLVQYEV